MLKSHLLHQVKTYELSKQLRETTLKIRSMKLKLVNLLLKKCINKLFIHFIELLFVGLRNKTTIIVSLLIVHALLQYNPEKNAQKIREFFSIYNTETLKIYANSDYILYGLLILVIISLWVLIFKINNAKIEFPAKTSLSNIEQLIVNDKIESALKKLYKRAKRKDEALSNEILLLKNRLFRSNKNRLNGILTNQDFRVIKNRVIKRIIDIVDELNLS